jgi:hypothetical protein
VPARGAKQQLPPGSCIRRNPAAYGCSRWVACVWLSPAPVPHEHPERIRVAFGPAWKGHLCGRSHSSPTRRTARDCIGDEAVVPIEPHLRCSGRSDLPRTRSFERHARNRLWWFRDGSVRSPAWPCSPLPRQRRDGDARSALRRAWRQLAVLGLRAHLGQPLAFVRLRTVAAQSWPQAAHRHHAFKLDPAPSVVGSISGLFVGEVRRRARAAGQRVIAPSGRVEARVPAGDGERIVGSRPQRTARTRAPAIHARTSCKSTTPAGSTVHRACADQGRVCASGAARPRAAAPCDSGSARA